MDTRTRSGFFEAPAHPPATRRIVVDPSWSPRRLSWEIIRDEWRLLLAGSLLLVAYNVAVMLVPVVIGGLVASVVEPLAAGTPIGDVLPLVIWWALAIIVLYVVINIGYRFGGRIGWLAVQRSQFEVAQAVLERVLDGRGMAGRPRSRGGVLSVATSDAHRTCRVLYVTIYPPGQIVGLLVASSVLLSVNVWLGVGVIVALPCIVFGMHRLTTPFRQRSQRERAGLADAAGAAADLVAGFRVLRGLHAQSVAASRYRDVSRSALDSTIAARRAKATFDGISIGVAQLFAVAVVVAAAVLAFLGHIGAAQLVTVAGIAVTLVQPLNGLVSNLASYWAIAQASGRRVLDLIGTPPNPAALGTREVPSASAVPDDALPAEDSGVCAPAATAPLEFAGLDIADGVTLTARIETGEFVVLDVPQVAHGRLADVLSLQAPAAADDSQIGDGVRMHGAAISTLSPVSVRERVLVVPHASGILSGSVLDNARATGDAPGRADAARAALRVASLDPDELPDRFDTLVGDDGWELSGGQRQRISLARAVATDPEVLVLIEPTTSVDAVTEQRIAARLHDRRAGRTTVVVTGSPAFRAIADRIISADADGNETATANAHASSTAPPTSTSSTTDPAPRTDGPAHD